MPDRPSYLAPRAAPAHFPYRCHRTLAQVARDDARSVFDGLPPFLRRMMIDAEGRP